LFFVPISCLSFLLCLAEAQTGNLLYESSWTVADERLVNNLTDVNPTEFLRSIMVVSLKRGRMPVSQGYLNGIENFITTEKFPKLHVVVGTEKTYPTSVTTEPGERVINKDGVNMRMTDIKKIDMPDLLLQNVGATQQLVRDSYSMMDLLKENRKTWNEKFAESKSLIQYLEKEKSTS
jgi:hypothetical protein